MRLSSFLCLGCLLAASLPAAAESAREVFWGTPNYTYGDLKPAELRERGFTYMLHLICWNQWETATDQWNETYLDGIVELMDNLAKAGIKSAVRLAEGHPGALTWTTAQGKPYLGRNPEAHPGREDTDERYLNYLRKLVGKLKGRVDHYVLGDELDMIFGASYDNPNVMRQYFDFFVKAAAAIRQGDPQAKVVMYPSGWGALRAFRNLQCLHELGFDRHGDGLAMNVWAGEAYHPTELVRLGQAVKALSPRYELYGNGFGYCVDRVPERSQALAVANTMIRMWTAGWSYAPYYLPASHSYDWSSGLYAEDLQNGGIQVREAGHAFQRLANLLRRHPHLQEGAFVVTHVTTCFGNIPVAKVAAPTIRTLWTHDDAEDYGLVFVEPVTSLVKLKVIVGLSGPARAGSEEGGRLVVENCITGKRKILRMTPSTPDGPVTAELTISAAPQILKWEKRRASESHEEPAKDRAPGRSKADR